jgi:hypothetical protein
MRRTRKTGAVSTTARAAPSANRAAAPPRQGLARALVAVGLIAITVWWLSWAAGRSILDANRSEAIGRALVHDDTVRDEVESQVREGMYLSGATSLGFTEADLAAAAAVVAIDPAVEGLIAERVAEAHRNALRPPDPFAFLSPADDQPFVDSSIRALEAQRADITIPDLQWLFATSVSGSFPDLTAAADRADSWRTPALLLAVFGFVASAVAHPDRRPRRWLARWCLTAGILTLALAYTLPSIGSLFGSDTGSAVRAVGASLQGGEARRGAILLVLIGALLSLGTWAKEVRTNPVPRPVGPARMPTGPILLGSKASTAPAPPAVVPSAMPAAASSSDASHRPDRDANVATAAAIRQAANQRGR